MPSFLNKAGQANFSVIECVLADKFTSAEVQGAELLPPFTTVCESALIATGAGRGPDTHAIDAIIDEGTCGKPSVVTPVQEAM